MADTQETSPKSFLVPRSQFFSKDYNLVKFWIQLKFEKADWSSLMRRIQKCNKMCLMVKNVRARFFEKGAIPKCPVYSSTKSLEIMGPSQMVCCMHFWLPLKTPFIFVFTFLDWHQLTTPAPVFSLPLLVVHLACQCCIIRLSPLLHQRLA